MSDLLLLTLNIIVVIMSPNNCFDLHEKPDIVDIYSDMAFADNRHLTYSPVLDYDKYKDDSGIDCEDLNFEIPNTELIKRIVKQVESYFSDENLIRDEFMNKNLRRNKGGFINLKLVASFRKVKTITKDWRVVAHAIRIGSTKLEMNDNCSKIRRKQSLPPVDSSSKYSRTVIVIDLPSDKENIDEIFKDFSVFGPIGLIRVIKPKAAHPNHIKLLNYIHAHIDSASQEMAIGTVEFNYQSDAEICLQQQQNRLDPAWSNSKFYILKKIEEIKSKNLNTNMHNSFKIEDLCSHVISKPAENQMIVITVTSSSVTLTSTPMLPNGDLKSKVKYLEKSKLDNISLNETTCCSSRSNCKNVLRNPYGPDGSSGFRHNQVRCMT